MLDDARVLPTEEISIQEKNVKEEEKEAVPVETDVEKQQPQVEESQEDRKETGGDGDLEPEEGWRAWVVVVGSFFAHFVCLGTLYSVGIYVVPYQQEFAVNQAEGALPYTIGAVFAFGGGAFAGRFADMFGVRIVSFVGLLFWATGYVLASFATEFWQVVAAHGVVAGIGTTCIYWPAVSVVAQWFNKRRALALGLSVVGAGVGNFVVGIGTQALIDAWDFRTALRVTAIVGTVLQGLAIVCLKRRLPLEKQGGILGDTKVLKDCKFILFLIAGMLFQFGYHSPFVFLARYARDREIDAGYASLCVGMLGVGSAVGRVLLGFVADKFGRLLTFRWNIGLTAITLWGWALTSTQESLAAFAFFYGFFSGGFIALIPVVIAEFYGTTRLGGISGIMSIALVPGVIAGPLLFGAIYDATEDYLPGILLCGGFVAVATMFIACMERVDAQKREAQVSEGK